jgi:hypothetical protein
VCHTCCVKAVFEGLSAKDALLRRLLNVFVVRHEMHYPQVAGFVLVPLPVAAPQNGLFSG